MENAVDALKIAFGILVFVIALTLAFMVFSQATQTSTKMLFASDKTNYYTYSEDAENEEGRIVGADVVISSLYRYYKESVVVRVYDKDGTTLLIKDSAGNGVEFNTETDGGLSQRERKKRVNELIKENSSTLTGTFLETFDEVKKSGKYIVEDDGSELTVQSGQASIYITYIKQ
ncbi:MAG: hypothetical protein U0M00_01165 [Clostridia bacterium]|nr:hypothetical protein [Clostridia bacterium]